MGGIGKRHFKYGRYLIYALITPDDKFPFYAGRSSTGTERPEKHYKNIRKVNTRKHEVIRASGATIRDYVVLEVVDAKTALERETPGQERCPWDHRKLRHIDAAEVWWIAFLGREDLGLGALTNMDDGGRGGSFNPHASTRAKLSAASSGDRNPAKLPGVGAKITAATLGSCRDADQCANYSVLRRTTTAGITGTQRLIRARWGDNWQPAPCGTDAAYQRAIRLRGQGLLNCGPCDACVEAHIISSRLANAIYRKKLGMKPRKTPACGTEQGYTRAATRARAAKSHCGPCVDCITAHIEHLQSERKPARELVPCGTPSAYTRALRRNRSGLPSCGPCELCREARRSAGRALSYAQGRSPRGPLRPCGTFAAYTRASKLRRVGKPNCGPCRLCTDAAALASAAQHVKRRKKKRNKKRRGKKR